MSKIPYTTKRSGIYYCQFWYANKLIKFSLETDSPRQAEQIMIRVKPCIHSFKSGLIDKATLLSVVNMGCKLVPIVTELQPHNIVKQVHRGSTLEELTIKKLPSVLKITLLDTEYTVTTIDELINIGNSMVDGVTIDSKDNTIFCTSHFFNYQLALTNDNALKVVNKLADTFKTQSVINKLSETRDYINSCIGSAISKATKDMNTSDFDLNIATKINKKAKADISPIVFSIAESFNQELQRVLLEKSHGNLLTQDVLDKIRTEIQINFFSLPKIMDAVQSVYDSDPLKSIDILESIKSIPIQKQQNQIYSVNANKRKKQEYLFSQLASEYNDHWISTQKRQGKSPKNYKDRLKRYEQYAKKIIAVSDDFDVVSTKKSIIFEYLTTLLDWPDMNQSGSIYNTKKESFGYPSNNKPQAWFNIVAKSLDDIKDDDNIFKAAASLDEILDYIQSVYKYAVEHEIIRESPVSTPPQYFNNILKTKANDRGPYLSLEMGKIIEKLNTESNENKWPILLMIYTGCRNSEIYKIKKEDVNIEKQNIFINGTKTKQAKRYVPISKKLIEYGFIEFINNIKGKDTYILSQCTAEYNLNQKFFDIIEDLSIPITHTPPLSKTTFFRSLYSVRKSFSTYAKGDPNLKEILLGHSIRTSDRPEEATYAIQEYMAEDTEELRAIVNSLPY